MKGHTEEKKDERKKEREREREREYKEVTTGFFARLPPMVQTFSHMSHAFSVIVLVNVHFNEHGRSKKVHRRWQRTRERGLM